MPESPLERQIRVLRQLAEASPTAREEANQLADSLEREVAGNRQAAAGEAFLALSQQRAQHGSPAQRRVGLDRLRTQVDRAYQTFTPAPTLAEGEESMQAANVAELPNLGRVTNLLRDQVPGVSGAQDALVDFTLRLGSGASKLSHDMGTDLSFSGDELSKEDQAFRAAIDPARAELQPSLRASPVGRTIGGAAPYVGAALTGLPGILALGIAEGVGTYGESKDMGLDPADAARRGLTQGGITAAGMLATPFSRLAAASNAAKATRGVLAREALEVGAGTLDALPQSLVMDVGGGAADVLHARQIGQTGGELEQAGKERMATLPTAPELLLADVGMEALMSPFRVRGHRAAQKRLVHERGALRDAMTLIEGQRIADNNADLQKLANEDDAFRSLLSMTPDASPPLPDPTMSGDPLPPMPPVDGRGELRRQMGMPGLDAGLRPLVRTLPEVLSDPYTPVDAAIMTPEQAAIQAELARRAADPGWSQREQGTRRGVELKQAQIDAAEQRRKQRLGERWQAEDPHDPQGMAARLALIPEMQREAPRPLPQQQVPASAGAVRTTRIDSSDEGRYQRAVETVAQAKDIPALQARAAKAAETLGLDPNQSRQLLLDAAAAWRARRAAEKAPDEPSPAPAPAKPVTGPIAASLAPAPGGRNLPELRPPSPAGPIPAAEPAAAGGPRGSGDVAPRPPGAGDASVAPPTPEPPRAAPTPVAAPVPAAPVAVPGGGAPATPAKPATALGGYQGNKETMWTAARDALGKVGNAFAKPIALLKGSVKRILEPFGGSGIHGGYFKRALPSLARELGDRDPIIHEIHRRAQQDPAGLTAEVNAVADRWEQTIQQIAEARRQGASEADQLAIADSFARTLEGNAAGEIARHAVGDVGQEKPQVKRWVEGAQVQPVSKIRRAAAAVEAHGRELAGDTVTPTPEDAIDMLSRAGKGDLVVLDPPYIDTADYRAGKEHSSDIEKAVAFITDHVRPALARGAHVIYTNAPHPRILKALQDAGLNIDIVWVRSRPRKRTMDDPPHPDPKQRTIGEMYYERPEVVAYSDPSRTYTAASAPAAQPGGPPLAAAHRQPADAGSAPALRLSDAVHKLATADAAGVAGVESVTRDANGLTVLNLHGGRKVAVVADNRPAEDRNPASWLASLFSRPSVTPAMIQRAIREAVEAHTDTDGKPDIKLPGWLTQKKIDRQTIERAWHNLLAGWQRGKGKPMPPLVKAAMEGNPVLAALLPNGKVAGYEHAIGLTPNYRGKELREETWHLGWNLLPKALQAEVLRRLPSEKQKAVSGDRVAEMEEATGLLMRLWSKMQAEGRAPKGWFARIRQAMWEGAKKLMPFLKGRTDNVRELAREFGEGRVFARTGGEAMTVGADATALGKDDPSVHRDARRAAAEANDTNRTTWAEERAEAQELLRDERRLNALVNQLDNGDLRIDRVQANAIKIAVEEATNAALESTGSKTFGEKLKDADIWRAYGTLVSRDAAQRLNFMRDGTNEPNIIKAMRPLMKMNAHWSTRFNAARSPEAKAAVQDAWDARRSSILAALAQRGIDLSDPKVRRTVDDMEADAVAELSYQIDSEVQAARTPREMWEDLSAGRIVSDTVMRNLLWPGSAIPQAASTGYFLGRGGIRGAVESLFKDVGGLDREVIAGLGGRAQAARSVGSALVTGVRMGLEAVRTGNSVAKPRLTGRDAGDEVMAGQEYRSYLQDIAQAIKMPWLGTLLRTGVGPGLEAVRFMDEVAWTMTFDMTRRGLSAERAEQSGRSIEDVMHDQDIVDDAVKHADRVTQRTRPDADTAYGKVFGAVEALRSPTLGGTLTHEKIGNWSKLLYNPGFHFMPIFRSVAILTGEAIKLAAAPVRGGQAAWNLRTLRSPERLASEAGKRQISEDALRRELTQDFFNQLTDTVIGTLGYAIAAMLSEDDLQAPRGGQESPEKARALEAAKPQGRVLGVPTGRLSPIHELMQVAAATRDVAKGRQSTDEAVTGLGRMLLEKPLVGGVKGMLGRQTDPRTGEKTSAWEYLQRQMKRQTYGGVGMPYGNLARAYGEAEQTRPQDPEAFGLGGERVPSRGLTGEGRDVVQGVLGRGLLGTSPTAKASEKELVGLLEELNEKVLADLKRTLKPGERPADGKGEWWPGRLENDLPAGDMGKVRMSPELQERMNELAGRAWWEKVKPLMPALREQGSSNPRAALDRLKRLRSNAARAALRTVKREAAQ